jgi:outer membrane protein
MTRPSLAPSEKTVNPKNILRRASITLACLLVASAVHAQSTPPKIAVINLRLAIASTAEGKQALADFETRFNARQKDIDDINRKIDEIARQFAEKQNTWSDEQKAKAQQDGQRLTRQLNRKQAAFQDDRNAAKDDIVQHIGGRLLPIVDRYARENNLGTVIDSSATGTPLLFVAPTSDITEAVAKLYDRAYPVKSAAATPAKPPAPANKPASVPTKP